MTRRMRLLFLVAILVIIAGLNMVSQSINTVTGSDYPGLIRYDNTGIDAQLTVLGRDYSLSPGVVQAVEQVGVWRDQLEGFLGKVEEIVKKYGRHAQEMMRNLPGRNQEFQL
ncbi:MAG: hypothetical protein GX262_07615 [Clostridia bacterium]|jgi:hypothetical protein|nr:hypothetical protein [Clostridia bacterium]